MSLTTGDRDRKISSNREGRSGDMCKILTTRIETLREDEKYRSKQKRLDEKPKIVNLTSPAGVPSSCLMKFDCSVNEQYCNPNIFQTAHFEELEKPCAKSGIEHAQIVKDYEKKMEELENDSLFRLMMQRHQLEVFGRNPRNNHTNRNNGTSTNNPVFQFSKPGVPYSFEMEYGEPVYLAVNEDNSCFAISIQHRDIYWPSDYFSRICRKRVKARKLRFIEQNEATRRYNITLSSVENAYVLEFESFRDKEYASRRIQLKEAHISAVGAIDFSKTFNSVALKVFYNERRAIGSEGKIVLEDPYEFDFACRALSLNGLQRTITHHPEIAIKQLVDKYDYDGGVPLIILDEPTISSDAELKSYVGKIFEANNIRAKSVGFETTNGKMKDNWSKKTLFGEMIENIDLEQNFWGARSENKKLVYRTETLKVEDADKGERGLAAYFLDGSYKRSVKIASEFDQNYQSGSTSKNKFLKNDYKPLRATAQITKFLSMSMRVRIAFDRTIKNFDAMIREKTMERKVDPRITTSHLHIKIVEIWQDKEEIGTIGIQGWNEKDVNTELFNLEALLQPVVLDCVEQQCEDLLHGAGEVYARQVLRSFGAQVAADFDKFNRKISVFGDEAQSAVNKLKTFKAKKPYLYIKVLLNIGKLYAAKNFVRTFLHRMAQQISNDLNCKIFYDEPLDRIDFQGSWFALDAFITILSDGSSRFSDRYNMHSNSKCPVCFNPISEDIYRLKKCSHAYCRVCVNNMVRNAIETQRIPVRCLCEGCRYFVSPSDFEELLLGGEGRLKEFDCKKIEKLCNSLISNFCKDPRSMYRVCPTADCPGIIERQRTNHFAASSSTPFSRMECSHCEKVYCHNCTYPDHSGRTCQQERRLRDSPDISLHQYMNANRRNVKSCPNCAATIEKYGGCFNVFCESCKIHFCWLCRFMNGDSKRVYKHLTETHSRISDEYDRNGIRNQEY